MSVFSRSTRRALCGAAFISLASGQAMAQSAADWVTPEYLKAGGWVQVNAAIAYALGYTGKGVVVGMLDTGLDVRHSEFRGRLVPGYDYTNNWTIDPATPNNYLYGGHGSHVAGIIVAARDGIQMHGVAFNAQLMPANMNDNADPNLKFSQAWVDFANRGVKIVNNSIGENDCNDGNNHLPPCNVTDYGRTVNGTVVPPVTTVYPSTNSGTMGMIDAMRYTAEKDVLMVFATGNEDQPHPDVMAGMPHWVPELKNSWLAVTSVDPNNQISSFSNKCGVAADWCLSAPGDPLFSTVNTSETFNGVTGYNNDQGTSMAAPVVSGVAALVKEAFPWMTARDLQQTVLTTATSLGDRAIFGWGMVNAGKAVRGYGVFTADATLDTKGFSSTFSNDISGTGGLTKLGAGILTTTGNNTFSGATFVDGGGLAINGRHRSHIDVGVKGMLLGTGIIHAPVSVSGALAPGNSVGTLTIAGTLTMAAGSTYQVEVSSAGADRTNVVAGDAGNGSASLSGGTVVTSYAEGTSVAKEYVIVDAEGGLGGTRFAALGGAAPTGFSQSLSYSGNRALLNLALSMGNWSGLGSNQSGVAAAISDYFNRTGTLPSAFGALTGEGLAANSGASGGGAQQAGMGFGAAFMGAIGGPDLGGQGGGASGDSAPSAYTDNGISPAAERFGRLSYAAEELASGTDGATRAMRLQHRLDSGFGEGSPSRPERFSIWGASLGGGMSIAANAATGAAAVSGSLAGIASGFDYAAGGTRAGIALGASWSSSVGAGGLGTAVSGNFSAGVRASHDFGRLYVAGAFAYGIHAVGTARSFGGETYAAAFLGQSVTARAEAGWRFRTTAIDLFPFVAGSVGTFSAPAYSETGSGAGTFALAYQPSTAVETRSELGLRLNKVVAGSAGSATTFSGMVGWAHYFSRGGNVTAGFANLPGTRFVTQGATGASDTALVSLGVAHRFANGVGLGLNADGEFGAGTIGYSAKAQLRYGW
jgi:subtilase-type serine protease